MLLGPYAQPNELPFLPFLYIPSVEGGKGREGVLVDRHQLLDSVP